MKKKFFLLPAIVIAAVATSVVSCHKPPPPPTPKENVPPNAMAGADQIITLPQNSAILDGSQSTDTDGYIVSFTWSQVSGPARSAIHDDHAMQSVVNYLAEGVYYFELTVIDDLGGISKDEVMVKVCG